MIEAIYRGEVAQKGQNDRFEAVLVKNSEALFAPVVAFDQGL